MPLFLNSNAWKRRNWQVLLSWENQWEVDIGSTPVIITRCFLNFLFFWFMALWCWLQKICFYHDVYRVSTENFSWFLFSVIILKVLYIKIVIKLLHHYSMYTAVCKTFKKKKKKCINNTLSKCMYLFYLNAGTTRNIWKKEKYLFISYVGTEGFKYFMIIYLKSLLKICIFIKVYIYFHYFE